MILEKETRTKLFPKKNEKEKKKRKRWGWGVFGGIAFMWAMFWLPLPPREHINKWKKVRCSGTKGPHPLLFIDSIIPADFYFPLWRGKKREEVVAAAAMPAPPRPTHTLNRNKNHHPFRSTYLHSLVLNSSATKTLASYPPLAKLIPM